MSTRTEPTSGEPVKDPLAVTAGSCSACREPCHLPFALRNVRSRQDPSTTRVSPSTALFGSFTGDIQHEKFPDPARGFGQPTAAPGFGLRTLAEVYGVPADEAVIDVDWLTRAGQQGWVVLMKTIASVIVSPSEPQSATTWRRQNEAAAPRSPNR